MYEVPAKPKHSNCEMMYSSKDGSGMMFFRMSSSDQSSVVFPVPSSHDGYNTRVPQSLTYVDGTKAVKAK